MSVAAAPAEPLPDYTVKEVAAISGVHRNTVVNWIRKKTIPWYRFGKDFRIPREGFDRLRANGNELRYSRKEPA